MFIALKSDFPAFAKMQAKYFVVRFCKPILGAVVLSTVMVLQEAFGRVLLLLENHPTFVVQVLLSFSVHYLMEDTIFEDKLSYFDFAREKSIHLDYCQIQGHGK